MGPFGTFLAGLNQNPKSIGKFLANPDAVGAAAGLTNEQVAALRNGDKAKIDQLLDRQDGGPQGTHVRGTVIVPQLQTPSP